MSWPADPVRLQVAAAVAAAVLTGNPKQIEWDRGERLGTQAWRRFSVLASGGSLESLSEAPAIGSGGIVYIERSYTLTVYYERGKNKQSLGADSDALTDDAERFIGALLRMNYDTPNTGLMRLKPETWNIVELPNGALSTEIEMSALVRREL